MTQSLLRALGMPEAFGLLLLTIGLVLCLSPWCGGKGFGTIRVPEFSAEAKRVLRFLGPCVLLIAIGLHIPLISVDPAGPKTPGTQHVH